MTVVVAYLPKGRGERALDVAISEAKLRGERLLVVNASKGDALVDPSFASHDAVESIDTRLAAAGIEHEVIQDVGPDVAQAVLQHAAGGDVSILVIGLRKRSPIGKLVMGSVAQQLLLNSTIPVLAVPAADPDRAATKR